jgi:hypothetical protein
MWNLTIILEAKELTFHNNVTTTIKMKENFVEFSPFSPFN